MDWRFRLSSRADCCIMMIVAMTRKKLILYLSYLHSGANSTPDFNLRGSHVGASCFVGQE